MTATKVVTWTPTPMDRDEMRQVADVAEAVAALKARGDVRDADGDPIVSIKEGPTHDSASIRYVRHYTPIKLNKDGTRSKRQGMEYDVALNRVLVPRDFNSGPTAQEEESALRSILRAVQRSSGSHVIRVNLDAIEAELRAGRREQLHHGHDWDVADVMDILRRHHA